MARPNKKGLDYFPMNVDFFEDDKIQLIEGEFGPKGSYVAVRLLCKIYNEGYYYQWGEDQCLLFAKNTGLVQNLINEVVLRLVKRSFFDEGVFERFQILTSRGIQERYLSIVKTSKIKRDKINKKYDLITISEETLKTPEETGKSSEEMSETPEESTQRKGKESKEKESKENNFRTPDLSESNLFRQPNVPTKNEVLEVFIRNGGTEEMANVFWERNESTSWYVRGSPITNFRNLVGSFVDNWKKNESKKYKNETDHAAAAIGRKIQEDDGRAILASRRQSAT